MTPSPDAWCPSQAVAKVKNVAGWSSPVAREAHNLEVTGSNPVPATLRPPGHPWPRRAVFLRWRPASCRAALPCAASMAPGGLFFCAGARPPARQPCGLPHPWPVSPFPMLVNEDWSMAHVKAEDSAKLAYLEELLDEVVAGEHRALLFCRSTPDAPDLRTIPRPVGDQGPAARRQHTDGPASAAGRSIQLLARDHRLPPQHGRQQRHQSHQCRHRNLLRPRLESSQRTPPSPCRRKTTNWTT